MKVHSDNFFYLDLVLFTSLCVVAEAYVGSRVVFGATVCGLAGMANAECVR